MFELVILLIVLVPLALYGLVQRAKKKKGKEGSGLKSESSTQTFWKKNPNFKYVLFGGLAILIAGYFLFPLATKWFEETDISQIWIVSLFGTNPILVLALVAGVIGIIKLIFSREPFWENFAGFVVLSIALITTVTFSAIIFNVTGADETIANIFNENSTDGCTTLESLGDKFYVDEHGTNVVLCASTRGIRVKTRLNQRLRYKLVDEDLAKRLPGKGRSKFNNFFYTSSSRVNGGSIDITHAFAIHKPDTEKGSGWKQRNLDRLVLHVWAEKM
jgi:hypothetical protein